MKNIAELRQVLIETFEGLRDGSVTIEKAKEISHCAGKIMDSCKIEMQYQILTGNKGEITFISSAELAAPKPALRIQAIPPEPKPFGFEYWAVKALNSINMPMISFYLHEKIKEDSGKVWRGYETKLNECVKSGVLKTVRMKDKFSTEAYYCLPGWVSGGGTLANPEQVESLRKNGITATE